MKLDNCFFRRSRLALQPRKMAAAEGFSSKGGGFYRYQYRRSGFGFLCCQTQDLHRQELNSRVGHRHESGTRSASSRRKPLGNY